MKLHLHWLRFDLHRFRLLLGVWTLLVAAYAVFLGWVHLRFLTISQAVMDRSLYIAILLGLVELCFLFTLFNADPAKGPRHFWKTRPPSGVAVAGSKLVLALVFFVALPLLAWWAVNALCVLPQYAVTQSPTGVSWTVFLFWAQSLVVSAFALAAARSANKMEFHLHLLVCTGVVACGVWTLQEIWVWVVREIWSAFSVSPVDLRLARWLGNGFVTLPMAVLTLAAACLYLLQVRRRRLPHGQGLASLMLLPTGAMLFAAAIFDTDSRTAELPIRDELPPLPDPATAIKIRVTEMPLHTGDFREVEYPPRSYSAFDSFNLFRPPPRQMRFSTVLKVEGLPPGVRVSARWLDLRLTAPDGTVIRGEPRSGKLGSGGIHQDNPDNLFPWSVNFPKRELEAWSTVPCTGSGTLRLTLYAWKNQLLPLPDGQRRSGPWGPLVMRRTREDLLNLKERAEWINSPSALEDAVLNSVPDAMWFFDLSSFNSGYPPINSLGDSSATFEAVKGRDNIPIKMALGRKSFPTGFLIRHELLTGAAFIKSKKINPTKEPDNLYVFEDWGLLKAVYTGRTLPDGWQLRIGSSEPYAAVDVPVTLNDVVPWTGRGTGPALLKALSTVHLRKNTSQGSVRSDLRHAYGLISSMPNIRGEGGHLREWHQAVTMWQGILDEADHGDLPVLLELIQEKNYFTSYDEFGITQNSLSPTESIEFPTHPFHLLIKRTAALLQPADMAGIPADSHTAWVLRGYMGSSTKPEPVATPTPMPSAGGEAQ
ncbi:MAG: hypothetical protein JWM59_2636 [Verrucomicrobiales bacterium]|nr:hypothetical protein [Verrucomicrobiales bacterium]